MSIYTCTHSHTYTYIQGWIYKGGRRPPQMKFWGVAGEKKEKNNNNNNNNNDNFFH